jgi:hypothetical protein
MREECLWYLRDGVVVASGFLFGRAQTEIFLSLSQLCASVDIPSPILVGAEWMGRNDTGALYVKVNSLI